MTKATNPKTITLNQAVEEIIRDQNYISIDRDDVRNRLLKEIDGHHLALYFENTEPGSENRHYFNYSSSKIDLSPIEVCKNFEVTMAELTRFCSDKRHCRWAEKRGLKPPVFLGKDEVIIAKKNLVIQNKARKNQKRKKTKRRNIRYDWPAIIDKLRGLVDYYSMPGPDNPQGWQHKTDYIRAVIRWYEETYKVMVPDDGYFDKKLRATWTELTLENER